MLTSTLSLDLGIELGSSASMDYNAGEQSLPLLPSTSAVPKAAQKRSKLLTVCPFILGEFRESKGFSRMQ